MTLVILLLVLLLESVLAGHPFGFSHLLFKSFGRTSGLDKLGQLYPAASPPAGEKEAARPLAGGEAAAP